MNHLVARLSCVRLISCYPDAISANCCEAWAWPLTERSPTAVPTSTAGTTAGELSTGGAGSWVAAVQGGAARKPHAAVGQGCWAEYPGPAVATDGTGVC